MAYTNIKKSTDYFDTRTYSASGAGSISDLNFQPDFIWFKNRTIVGDHGLFDAVRGVTKYLISNSTSAGLTGNGTSSDFLSFDTNGYTYGTSSQLDVGAGTPVTWCWKANGTGVANTDGSISSTVSANTTSGFSIVKYTAGSSGAVSTIGHGLNSVPKMIMVKGIDSNSTPDQWMVYHEALGNTKRIKLNSTDAAATGSGYWNNTTPTSSLFTVGNSSEGNSGNGLYIAYCFAEKQGFSKFGSYTGNGSASDGTFVYTGFKPSWILVKSSSAGSTGWNILDNKRDPENVMDTILQPNNANADANDANKYCDFLSNGFKWRASGGETNGSGTTYIYMAFASEPLVGDNPATAR